MSGLTYINRLKRWKAAGSQIEIVYLRISSPDVIAQSMQLITGSTAQEYNQRRGREGALWEDRYHATVIEAHEHLHRCLVYIDLNMVRAG